jgi:hypothetical protein
MSSKPLRQNTWRHLLFLRNGIQGPTERNFNKDITIAQCFVKEDTPLRATNQILLLDPKQIQADPKRIKTQSNFYSGPITFIRLNLISNTAGIH